MSGSVDVFSIRTMVARGARLGRFAFGFGALWCAARAWMESQGIGFDVPWPVYLVGVAVNLALLVRWMRAAKRLDRPAVQVSDDEIVWGSVFRERRRRLPMDEVRAVRSEGVSALSLDTRSQGTVRLVTYEVVPEERAALRQAIARRIRPEAAASASQ